MSRKKDVDPGLADLIKELANYPKVHGGAHVELSGELKAIQARLATIQEVLNEYVRLLKGHLHNHINVTYEDGVFLRKLHRAVDK